MGYRDDRDATALQIAELERDNERLRERLSEALARAQAVEDERHERRRASSQEGCVMCGGALHPVAVFTGHSLQSPMRLHASTIRFAAKSGGFTHAAVVRSLACTSCGYIHSYIDMDGGGASSLPSGSSTAAPSSESTGLGPSGLTPTATPRPAGARDTSPDKDDR